MPSPTQRPSRSRTTSHLLRVMNGRLQPGAEARRLVLLRGYCAIDTLAGGRGTCQTWDNLQHLLGTVSMLCALGHESAFQPFVEDCMQCVLVICDASPSPATTDWQLYEHLCECLAILERQLLAASEDELRRAVTTQLPAMTGWNHADRLRARWIWGMSEAFGTGRTVNHTHDRTRAPSVRALAARTMGER